MANEIFERLRKIISDQLGVEDSEIQPSSHLVEDLNADPISIADLSTKIEEEFDLKIPETNSTNFKTVEDLINFVSDQSGEI